MAGSDARMNRGRGAHPKPQVARSAGGQLQRGKLATVLLALVVAVPVFATSYLDSIQTVKVTTWCLLAFSAALLPETLLELRQFWRYRLFRFLTAALLFCVTSWHFHQGMQWDVPRMWFCGALVLYFASSVAWLRLTGDRGIRISFWIKLGVTLVALVVLGVAIWESMPASEVLWTPPIYRHLRHANYDLALVIGLAILHFAGRDGRFDWRAMLVFVILGYFSFWSGGRGEMLALLVIWAALIAFHAPKSILIIPIIGLLTGGLLVVLTGQTELMLGAIERSAGDSMNSVTSGRLRIWTVSLERLWETPYSALFGYGPDAFVRLAVYQDVWPGRVTYIVQPHNMVVQWLLEFGIVGTMALMGLLAQLVRCAFRFLRGNNLDGAKSVSAVALGMLVFGMTDGVYYHAAPMTFIVLLWAYLYLCHTSDCEISHRQSNVGKVPACMPAQ